MIEKTVFAVKTKLHADVSPILVRFKHVYDQTQQILIDLKSGKMINKLATGAVLFCVMIAGLSSCAILPISPGFEESRGFPFEKSGTDVTIHRGIFIMIKIINGSLAEMV